MRGLGYWLRQPMVIFGTLGGLLLVLLAALFLVRRGRGEPKPDAREGTAKATATRRMSGDEAIGDQDSHQVMVEDQRQQISEDPSNLAAHLVLLRLLADRDDPREFSRALDEMFAQVEDEDSVEWQEALGLARIHAPEHPLVAPDTDRAGTEQWDDQEVGDDDGAEDLLRILNEDDEADEPLNEDDVPSPRSRGGDTLVLDENQGFDAPDFDDDDKDLLADFDLDGISDDETDDGQSAGDDGEDVDSPRSRTGDTLVLEETRGFKAPDFDEIDDEQPAGDGRDDSDLLDTDLSSLRSEPEESSPSAREDSPDEDDDSLEFDLEGFEPRTSSPEEPLPDDAADGEDALEFDRDLSAIEADQPDEEVKHSDSTEADDDELDDDLVSIAAGDGEEDEYQELSAESVDDDLEFDMDLAGLRDDLSSESEPQPTDDGEDTFTLGEDDSEVKLDLARAYVSMGDKDAARTIVEEVLAEGSESQKEAARKLLEGL